MQSKTKRGSDTKHSRQLPRESFLVTEVQAKSPLKVRSKQPQHQTVMQINIAEQVVNNKLVDLPSHSQIDQATCGKQTTQGGFEPPTSCLSSSVQPPQGQTAYKDDALPIRQLGHLLPTRPDPSSRSVPRVLGPHRMPRLAVEPEKVQDGRLHRAIELHLDGAERARTVTWG